MIFLVEERWRRSERLLKSLADPLIRYLPKSAIPIIPTIENLQVRYAAVTAHDRRLLGCVII
jgi:hypothetical protein